MNMLLFFAGIVCLIIGLFAAYGVIEILQQRHQMQSWSTAQGHITTSYVKESNGDALDPVYQAIIEYEYIIDGQAYTGDAFVKDGETRTTVKRMMEKRVEKYPVGEKVSVVYNPADPLEVYLESVENLRGTIAMGIFAVVLSGFGSVTLVTGLGTFRALLLTGTT